ncbi:MAG: DUF1289 domain-containing protein [Nevskia sp.]|nr:DUF1289 domain-containing protein [Nevskia sp.]
MEVKSPCINVCTLDPASVCTGCGRHIDEIAVWGAASPQLKQRIVEIARQRLAAMQPRSSNQAQNP